jgi:hypothetical protein
MGNAFPLEQIFANLKSSNYGWLSTCVSHYKILGQDLIFVSIFCQDITEILLKVALSAITRCRHIYHSYNVSNVLNFR